ncbi:rod shape-determining protein MreD [Gaiella occulta]|uniref:Rod shape-determining protein MreD n=1 Tax=Gaiella occulta TaxID=1002870 RepID=A0A7M2YWP2_9ACTN|nr:rod shape-determining protein MreD [Gaiella occulta]RDI74551.1 rod shape-determining protein MreD [Gaiella occulta]
MSVAATRIAPVVFVVAMLQVSAFSALHVLGGTPDALLVVLVSVALLRGSIAGAAAGFVAGLLVDAATLGTLGETALLLTLAGYWAGRYGETTGRGRRYAPPLAVAAITVLVGVGGTTLHYMLGDAAAAAQTLAPVLPGLALNLLLAYPIHRLVRRLVGERRRDDRVRGVEILV